jgi:hypothetical protein
MLHFPAATQAERANREERSMEKQKIEFWSLMMSVIRDFLAEMFVTVGQRRMLPPTPGRYRHV